jgi:aspartyl-tRNA(Asn)/glutamyl-tRNA(Gln) amidotransferase subunit A
MSIKQKVQHYLAQIEAQASLNAFIEVYADEALQQAEKLDARIAAGEKLGKLGGMVIGIKDVICYAQHQVSAASRILSGFKSLYTATALERIIAQDAIIIGRLNCDEFAMGSTNENSAYGVTRNAANPNKVPGGSSGASAVAVQAGLCDAALGSDTGGSVRQPAAFCGTVGFKPSYGRISRHGLIAYASSFDQIGVLTKNVQDAALLTEIMAGKDQFDATSAAVPVPPYSQKISEEKNRKFRIAYIDNTLNHKGLDPEIAQKIRAWLQTMQAQGHTVAPVSFDYLECIVPTYYILTTAEASSNLSRFDGIKYGYRAQANDMETTYRRSRSEGFGKEVKRRIMLGTFVLSAGYYDAYYAKAQKVRRLIANATRSILADYDFIVTPTTPSTAFDIGDKAHQDPIAMYLADIFTVQANLTGMPAISVPLFTHSNGLPFGLQIMADQFNEVPLLAFADAINS